ncbi:hypothetical protein SB6421_01587 [Klebsiella huaxiensis]|uniref:hypothetical protein n=1 Tax=Klebsiella huaxiensis TaxID=2153354 RepID=UPI00115A165C|nr:hypothetical protein [Klebsiella huaxiensis]VUT16854.1 hypothetical protein SB6421_01587 [Klebsiella huaxiensis]
MTSKLTREWLQHQISAIEAVGITDSNTLAAFKLALSAMDSEPVAWRVSFTQIGHESNNFTKTYWDEEEKDRWVKLHELCGFKVDIEPLYRHAQQPIVPDKMTAIVKDEAEYVEGWNACRAAMLKGGNSQVIPDSARDALLKALAAMEFMGDTLNNLDAVCTEDVEFVSPAFDAVRNVLSAAPQELK